MRDSDFAKSLKGLWVCVLLTFPVLSHALTITHEPYARSSILSYRFQDIIEFYKDSGFADANYLESRNYRQFFSMASEQKFDIVFASTVNARVLVEQYNYIPILVKNVGFRAVVIAHSKSDIQSVSDLSGKTVYTPDAYDPVSYLGKVSLKDVDANFVELSGTPKVIMMVATGEAEAGLVADIDLLLMKKTLRNRLNVIAKSNETASTYILVNNRNKSRIEKLKSTALRINSTDTMTKIADSWGEFEYIELDAASMESLYGNEEATKKIIQSLGE